MWYAFVIIVTLIIVTLMIVNSLLLIRIKRLQDREKERQRKFFEERGIHNLRANVKNTMILRQHEDVDDQFEIIDEEGKQLDVVLLNCAGDFERFCAELFVLYSSDERKSEKLFNAFSEAVNEDIANQLSSKILGLKSFE